MLLSLEPEASVNGAIDPVHLAVPLFDVFAVVALVLGARGPLELSVAVLLVHLVLASVGVGLLCVGLPPVSLTILHPVEELA